MRLPIIMLVGAAALVCPAVSRGQAFFNPGVSSFTPEISVVNTGVLNDVQATVSPDRRYVTLAMRPQNSQLLNLFEFTFQQGVPGPLATGFVGGVQFKAQTGEFGAINPAVVLAPGRAAALFAQRGMTPVLVR